jgi:hypothetical protein
LHAAAAHVHLSPLVSNSVVPSTFCTAAISIATSTSSAVKHCCCRRLFALRLTDLHCVPLQIDAIKAAAVERQAQLDRETAELKQQQDDLTAKLKEFQQRVSS